MYGESHGVAAIMDRHLEIWGEYYRKYNLRHLFIEVGYFTAELLNKWMQSDNDEILYNLFDDWAGTAKHVPHTLVFYKTIKSEFPETIFHGTDVGHQFNTTGVRFLQYLQDNNLQDTERYLLTRKAIEQGEHFHIHSNRDIEFRITSMAENFIREFDRLGNQSVMAIHGTAHTEFGIMQGQSFSTLAERLRERYGYAVHSDIDNENPHPFATALAYFLEVIPDTSVNFEGVIASHASAYLIDLDGNGTMGMLAYKALGEFDHFAIFYLHNGELRTLWHSISEFWRLGGFGESPFVSYGGGEGAGISYSIFSITPDGLTITSSLWATVHGYFYYNDSSVTEEEFNVLLEQYNLNHDRWLVLDLKPHTINEYMARPEAINPRRDDTAMILAMTMPME